MSKLCVLLLVTVLTATGCSKQETDSYFPSSVHVDAMVASTDIDETHYASIQEAIDAAPEGGWTIAIAPGEYYEQVTINKPGITLIGAGPKQTHILFDRYAGRAIAPHSKETWGTFRTATVEVTHPNTHIANLTIENSFDFLTNDAREKDDPNKLAGTQAVALKLGEYTDKTIIENVVLLGYQDTLYVQGGRTYITGGEIHGNVDFIFGNGNAYFENVDIISRKRGKDMAVTGYVTAPSTLTSDAFGFTFVNCRLKREEGVPDNSVALGRPWHPTTTFDDGRYANPFAVGNATFINTWMDSHVTTDGWDTMGGIAKDGSRKQFSPYEDARFSEFGSTGPGAVVNEKRPQTTEANVKIRTRWNVLDGWEPKLLLATP